MMLFFICFFILLITIAVLSLTIANIIKHITILKENPEKYTNIIAFEIFF